MTVRLFILGQEYEQRNTGKERSKGCDMHLLFLGWKVCMRTVSRTFALKNIHALDADGYLLNQEARSRVLVTSASHIKAQLGDSGHPPCLGTIFPSSESISSQKLQDEGFCNSCVVMSLFGCCSQFEGRSLGSRTGSDHVSTHTGVSLAGRTCQSGC